MKKYYLLLSLITLLLLNCGPKQQPAEEPETAEIIESEEAPSPLKPYFDAHGGVDRWRSFGTLSYDVIQGEAKEKHLFDLHSRKVLLEKEEVYQLGFDGKDVWVSPTLGAFDRNYPPRFYHNLLFYFFSLPFVYADPGVIVENMEPREVEGKTYNIVKISYQSGVGDSPKDEYINYFDAETNQLRYLLYTVTFFSGEKSQDHNAISYDQWQEVNGLLVPKEFTFRTWDGENFGEERATDTFENVQFKEETPDQDLFVRPVNAEVDTVQLNQ